MARRTSSGNGSRPTFTCGGVRNQNRILGRDLPWPPEMGSTSEKYSYPRLSRENFRKGTVGLFPPLRARGFLGFLRRFRRCGFSGWRSFHRPDRFLRALWRSLSGGPLRFATAMDKREPDLIAEA